MTVPSIEYHSRLLQQSRDGNVHAVNELLALYQHYLRVLAHAGLSRSLQSRVTVSDVIQETLLHAFTAIKQFRGQSREEFVVWIRTILASRIADAHEKHFHAARRDLRREVSIAAIAEQLSHSSINLETIARDYLQRSPGAAMAAEEDALLIANAIGTLPEEHQRVIIARHFESRSFEQIADQMGKSSGAVRMIWLRAIRKLRQLLKEGPP